MKSDYYRGRGEGGKESEDINGRKYALAVGVVQYVIATHHEHLSHSDSMKIY